MRLRCHLATGLILMGAVILVLGALMLKAAANTGANDNYRVSVTWGSAFASVLWPPWKVPLHYILVALIPPAVAWIAMIYLPRFIATPLLWFQVFLCWNWYQAGGLGLHLLASDLEKYHFVMHGERLGEYWLTLEAVGIWMLIAMLLGFLRLTYRSARVQPTEAPPAPHSPA